ncbi:EamA family transporter [Roseobacter sp.]|uniref:EamA family transporter n=1 Tax=Roseobacter sp. TaxID=1907202 RepID=UPI00385A30F3
MGHLAFGYFFTFFTAMTVIIGDFAIKSAVDHGLPITSKHVILGIALYGFSAILWFYAMQHVTLAQAGVAYSMLTLIALAVLGAVYFGEPLHTREYLGLGCALLSMILMSRIA